MFYENWWEGWDSGDEYEAHKSVLKTLWSNDEEDRAHRDQIIKDALAEAYDRGVTVGRYLAERGL